MKRTSTRPEYIVTGTGRSGSSFVTKCLQDMGVCMGHQMDMAPSDKHRVGARECRDMKTPTIQVLSRRMAPEEWLDKFNALHRDCGGACGVKHPDLAFLDKTDWAVIQPKWVIWTYRDPDKVEASFRKWGNDKGIWRINLALGKMGIRSHLHKNVVKIDMNEERSADWVKARLPRPKGAPNVGEAK